jgi:hypothetical protein
MSTGLPTGIDPERLKRVGKALSRQRARERKARLPQPVTTPEERERRKRAVEAAQNIMARRKQVQQGVYLGS